MVFTSSFITGVDLTTYILIKFSGMVSVGNNIHSTNQITSKYDVSPSHNNNNERRKQLGRGSCSETFSFKLSFRRSSRRADKTTASAVRAWLK